MVRARGPPHLSEIIAQCRSLGNRHWQIVHQCMVSDVPGQMGQSGHHWELDYQQGDLDVDQAGAWRSDRCQAPANSWEVLNLSTACSPSAQPPLTTTGRYTLDPGVSTPECMVTTPALNVLWPVTEKSIWFCPDHTGVTVKVMICSW